MGGGAVSEPTTLLALDPSFTATGWVVFDLADDSVLAAGVIRTPAPKKAAKKRGTTAQLDAERGLRITEGIVEVIRAHSCVIAVQEGHQAVRSTRAMSALTRAAQAAVSAVWHCLGGLPLFVSVHASKTASAGKLSASKAEVEAAVRARFPADWDALLEDVAPSKRENAFDAAAAYMAAYSEPAVAMARELARRAA